MAAMAVIFTCCVPTGHFLGVPVRIWTIIFPVPDIPRRISPSSPLFSSAHRSVACPVNVHPLFLLSVSRISHVAQFYAKLGMSGER